MEKQVFQAGFGNVNVGEFHPQRGRSAHDFWNQGATPAGVEIGGTVIS